MEVLQIYGSKRKIRILSSMVICSAQSPLTWRKKILNEHSGNWMLLNLAKKDIIIIIVVVDVIIIIIIIVNRVKLRRPWSCALLGHSLQ